MSTSSGVFKEKYLLFFDNKFRSMQGIGIVKIANPNLKTYLDIKQ